MRYFDKTEEVIQTGSPPISFHPDDLKRVIVTVRDAIQAGKLYETEHRLLGSDGKYRWFQICGNPLRDEEGRVCRWVRIAHRHRTDRKRALKTRYLETRESIYGRRSTHCRSRAWSTKLDGFVDFLSDRWLDYAGMSYQQAGGFGWGEVIHPDDAERLFGYWQSLSDFR